MHRIPENHLFYLKYDFSHVCNCIFIIISHILILVVHLTSSNFYHVLHILCWLKRENVVSSCLTTRLLACWSDLQSLPDVQKQTQTQTHIHSCKGQHWLFSFCSCNTGCLLISFTKANLVHKFNLSLWLFQLPSFLVWCLVFIVYF